MFNIEKPKRRIAMSVLGVLTGGISVAIFKTAALVILCSLLSQISVAIIWASLSIP